VLCLNTHTSVVRSTLQLTLLMHIAEVVILLLLLLLLLLLRYCSRRAC
jgi:hypothetical protein